MEDTLQEIVDALSVRLGRPVLVDDVDLRPLAYSTQFGELDFVRTASILGRAAPDPARDALFAHGIRTASKAVRIPAHPGIGMAARVCIPIVRGGRRLGYLWLLEDPPLGDDDLRLARAAASEAGSVLQSEADSQLDRRRHEQELIEALLSPEPGRAAAAAMLLEEENYLPLRPLVVCAGAGAGEEALAEGLDRLLARAPAKHALCGEVGGLPVCVAGADGPVGGEQLAEALRGVVPADAAAHVHVGIGDAVED
ncbi:MAG TPA: GAF domain-containing protein, partial [Solirubrobacter sp.]|nr:GAF domain-containing protein [Solirubrobacter sp.]